MLFTSPIFLFVFLPVVIAVSLVLRGRWRNVWLMAVSLVFYSWGEGRLIAIMLFSSGMDYLAAIGMSGGWRGAGHRLEPGGHRTRNQRLFLVGSLVINVALLGFFKYARFGFENVQAVAGAFGWTGVAAQTLPNIVLPLGISFYTFQSMSYTIDVYRGQVAATRNYVDFVAFVTMFPQLVAGPIVRYADVARELVHRVVTRPMFAAGVRRFIVGIGKKMLVANTMAVGADSIFAVAPASLTTLDAWFGVVCYALQIYFDFAGYSDMAIGIGKMFGFTFLENFNYPYIARSVQDFWRRWHMSMSTWFRDYVYIPLGGNRRSPLRTYGNLVAVFFVTGLWHGASWTFVIWGLWHGLFLIIERLGWSRWLERLWSPLRFGYVLVVVLIGWVLFRSDSFGQALAMVQVMFTGGATTATTIPGLRTPLLLGTLSVGIVASTPLLHRWFTARLHQAARTRRPLLHFAFDGAELAGLVLLFVTSMGRLASDTYNPFIYFRF